MIDPEERTKKLGDLDLTRLRGVRAAGIINDMQPVFDEMRGIFNRQLVENTKESGEPDDYTVWCLVVLSDIEAHLKTQARRGSSAANKIEQITTAGGRE